MDDVNGEKSGYLLYSTQKKRERANQKIERRIMNINLIKII